MAVPEGQSPSMQLRDTQTRREGGCHTFVVATRLGAGGPVRMRSYRTRDDHPFPACIWEVARATSAALTYFLPIEINKVIYGDGGAGFNNPTNEALLEARNIWPDRPIGIVVSLGTGLQMSLQLKDDGSNSAVPKLAQSLLEYTAPRYKFQLLAAEYAAKCLTNCELIHRDVTERSERDVLQGNYFRLNVSEEGMARIGLAEWEKLDELRAMTDSYMTHPDKRRYKRRIAELLRNPECAIESQ